MKKSVYPFLTKLLLVILTTNLVLPMATYAIEQNNLLENKNNKLDNVLISLNNNLTELLKNHHRVLPISLLIGILGVIGGVVIFFKWRSAEKNYNELTERYNDSTDGYNTLKDEKNKLTEQNKQRNEKIKSCAIDLRALINSENVNREEIKNYFKDKSVDQALEELLEDAKKLDEKLTNLAKENEKSASLARENEGLRENWVKVQKLLEDLGGLNNQLNDNKKNDNKVEENVFDYEKLIKQLDSVCQEVERLNEQNIQIKKELQEQKNAMEEITKKHDDVLSDKDTEILKEANKVLEEKRKLVEVEKKVLTLKQQEIENKLSQCAQNNNGLQGQYDELSKAINEIPDVKNENSDEVEKVSKQIEVIEKKQENFEGEIGKFLEGNKNKKRSLTRVNSTNYKKNDQWAKVVEKQRDSNNNLGISINMNNNQPNINDKNLNFAEIDQNDQDFTLNSLYCSYRFKKFESSDNIVSWLFFKITTENDTKRYTKNSFKYIDVIYIVEETFNLQKRCDLLLNRAQSMAEKIFEENNINENIGCRVSFVKQSDLINFDNLFQSERVLLCVAAGSIPLQKYMEKIKTTVNFAPKYLLLGSPSVESIQWLNGEECLKTLVCENMDSVEKYTTVTDFYDAEVWIVNQKKNAYRKITNKQLRKTNVLCNGLKVDGQGKLGDDADPYNHSNKKIISKDLLIAFPSIFKNYLKNDSFYLNSDYEFMSLDNSLLFTFHMAKSVKGWNKNQGGKTKLDLIVKTLDQNFTNTPLFSVIFKNTQHLLEFANNFAYEKPSSQIWDSTKNNLWSVWKTTKGIVSKTTNLANKDNMTYVQNTTKNVANTIWDLGAKLNDTTQYYLGYNNNTPNWDNKINITFDDDSY